MFRLLNFRFTKMSQKQNILCPAVPVTARLTKSFKPGTDWESDEIQDKNIGSSSTKNKVETDSFCETNDFIGTVPFSSRMLRPLIAPSEQRSDSSSPADVELHETSTPFEPFSTMDVSALVSDHQQYRRESQLQRRPDSFISLRITSDTLISKLSSIQSELVQSDPSTAPALTSPLTFHITLLAFCTGDVSENVENAKCILRQTVEELRRKSEGKLSLTFEGLGHFSQKVIFALLVNNKSLKNLALFAQSLTKKFRSNYKYKISEKSEFQAHLTLAKTSKTVNLARKYRLKAFKPKLTQKLISKYSKCILGEESFENVEILSMTKKKDSDGYYHCYDKYHIHTD